MGGIIVLAEYEEPGHIAGPLVQAGFHIETVDTADAAFRFCGINAVDLVISRVLFRYGMSGVELISRLQSLASPPRVILLTSHRADRLRKIPGFPPAGIPLVRKPVAAGELLELIQGSAS